jgi:predicted phage terminase large subunit-like protein
MGKIDLPFAIDPKVLLRAVEKRRCELSLSEFVRAAWHIIEPGQPYIHGWHIDFICEHLEAITDEVRFEDDTFYNRLLVNVPPGPGWVENLVMTDAGRVRLGDIKPGDRVLTHTGRFMPVSACYSKGMLQTLHVTTRSGREMFLTPDHNVLTPDGWVEAKDLRVGSVLGVVTPKDGIKTNQATPEEARLLGYLIGDGSITQATVAFTNHDEDTVQDFIRCCAACGFGCVRAANGVVRIHGGKAVHDWLMSFGLDRCSSYDKFIPDRILASSNWIIASFVGAYWSCDGMIEVRDTKTRGSRYRASATTVSKRLAQDLLHALTRIGIHARLRPKERPLETKAQPGGVYRSFNIEVYSEADTARFAGVPGLCARKDAMARKCTAKRFDSTLMEDPIVSVVDGGLRECMCISVDGDHSLTWSDIAVHNTMKSLLIGVFWPAWEWGPRNMPHMRYVCASHSQDLAIRDSLRMRRLVQSEWYQAHWGGRVQLMGDQNAKAKFETTKTGFRQACAFEGITGYRGDRVIIDDPHSVDDANSDAKRTTATQLFKEAVTSRLNNPDKSAIVVVMQRLHEEDVSGMILNSDMGYDHIMLPMRFDPLRACTTMLGVSDPRTEDGDLLFPERFPMAVVERDEAAMGPYATAGQYQQQPEPRGGGIVKDHWWQLWDRAEYPGIEYVVASLDSAYTEKTENDPSALTVWGVFSGSEDASTTRSVDRYGRTLDRGVSYQSSELGAVPKVMLMYAWTGKLALHDLVEKVESICRRMRVDKLLIENKASGHSVAQEIRRLYSGSSFAVQMYDPKALDKVARLYSVQHIFAEGMVYAPSKDWAEMVIRQTSVFPRGKNDDLVDTTSMALNHLRSIGMLTRAAERIADIEESKRFTGNNDVPLYAT